MHRRPVGSAAPAKRNGRGRCPASRNRRASADRPRSSAAGHCSAIRKSGTGPGGGGSAVGAVAAPPRSDAIKLSSPYIDGGTADSPNLEPTHCRPITIFVRPSAKSGTRLTQFEDVVFIRCCVGEKMGFHVVNRTRLDPECGQ